MENSKRAIIYIRVSDPSQLENNSLETQEKNCRQFAKSKGYEVVEPIFNEGFGSAKHVLTRPELRKALTFCYKKSNKVSYFIVYNFKRFSRNTEEGLAAISLLAKNEVEVISATEISEMNPIGRAMRTVFMAFGQMENEMKGETVKHNMQEVFRNGLWPFKCPIGYKRKYRTKEENKGLPPVQDLNLTPIIKDMFQKAADGIYSKAQLARIMNLAGFGDFYRRKADHKTVKNILEKTFYYGYMYAPKWDEYQWGRHEPMINRQVWEKAYQKLIIKKKKLTYQDDCLYPLKGTLKCDICNHNMTTSPSRGRGGIVYYYECKNKKCRKTRINSNLAHKQFKKILKDIQPSPRTIKLFNHMVFAEWDKVISSTAITIERLDNKILSLKNELVSIRKAKDDDIYTVEEAKEYASKTRQEIVVLEMERSDTKIEHYDTEIVKEFTEQFLNNLTRLWEAVDLAKRQELQRKILINGLYCQKDKKIRTPELSPSFELIGRLTTIKGKNVTPQGVEP